MAKKKTITKIQLGVALFNLAEHGVKSIRFDYNGGGDSGSIEEIYPRDTKGDHMKEDVLPKWNEIIEALSDWGYERLGKTDGDWVNNEGGEGEITVQVPSGEYTISHRVRTTEDFEYDGTVSSEIEEEEV